MSFACCDCRKTDRVKAVASNPDQSPVAETVGVGIVLKPSFQSDTFLALVVHSLVPGSSAEQSRMIQAGDILHSINDADVYRRPANEVAKRLLGRPGTTVKLGLLRLVSDGPPPEGTVLKPFPESLVTSEGTYEHIVVELQRKRIPQQSPRSIGNSPYSTPRTLSATMFSTPRTNGYTASTSMNNSPN
ncbi:hypothetical protein GUITHDRAFT_149737 [Guillardia theta CCMP2712]|uniref:PDZ domain-containing protein n=1 Tax=Guillardia theta (strain CCMP2712) TaxID=905079 RepID=L1K3U8_GUITC|nr:hypothetical protein GUITHDRAFT_149737 [Guillardia theta CCMP2712]EKX55247.1 hypothetical protein GUITHDRAFT_149737 [Guillardia theta CCMP2712]|mmetsp:Transcript_26959/g.88144  ORF Transcript_26959/g.88144 Transcript_26959/m.88144 type:complete len:188 (-) Transcript_26959:150-713(-)|eukprot:XP_005842227.1 hypothetical protein GUITHDRAFT_149737 [Guillardia theta CCMP2712]